METFSEPPTDSATTGLPSPDSEASSATGRPPGGTGYGETPKEYEDRPEVWAGIMASKQRREAHRAKLRRKAIDDAEWCKLPVTQLLRGYSAPPVLTDLDRGALSDLPPSLSEDQGRELSRMLPGAIKAATPAGPEAVAVILAKLSVVVLLPDTDEKVLMETYIEDLEHMPADVLERVCRQWRRTKKFWPTIAELLELCDGEDKRRRRRLRRLQLLDSVRRNPAPGFIITEDWYYERFDDDQITLPSAPSQPLLAAGEEVSSTLPGIARAR